MSVHAKGLKSRAAVQPREARAERLELRASRRQTAMIKRAAAAAGKTVTAFVLDAASVEAERALADRSQFSLDAKAWASFVEALDRPVAAKPRLRRLVSEPSVLERR
jgi:uncharacterized protein (DUF1778 family)